MLLLLLLLLFLTFSVLVANPKKLLYTVANPARGLLRAKNDRVGLRGYVQFNKYIYYILHTTYI